MTKPAPAAAALMPGVMLGKGDVIASSLAFVRSHLKMDIAYLSEFVGDDMILRAVEAPGFEDVLTVGDVIPKEDDYCLHVLSGRLPELIPDTNHAPLAQTFPLTTTLPVRSLVDVPVFRSDGSIFGMFCCLGRTPRPTLNARDLEVVCAFANMSGDQVNAQSALEMKVKAKKDAIEDILHTSGFEIALQPILRLQDHQTAGYEALCRFSPRPYRPPNVWFDDAAEVGLQSSLEITVIEMALLNLPQLPAGCYLAVNSSPATLASGRIADVLDGFDGSRVIVEITEHDAIDDLDVLLMEIDRLRELGVRIAVDDAGAGYSGLQQIVRIRPDVIKLDMSLTQDVDKDLARRSLASAMVKFARDTNAHVVAEGIETEAELRTLRKIGVEMGQGYHLGRPALASVVMPNLRRA